jgi:hypothetical protein
VLRKKEWRDPRGFILPADQAGLPDRVKFINALVKNGIAIHRATAAFTVGGKTYPAGSYIVKADQAFRPHVLDMFEPQEHPDDIPMSEGGPPRPPVRRRRLDTLAFQMGVQVRPGAGRPSTDPLSVCPGANYNTPRTRAARGAGVIASHRANNTFILANRLLKAGAEASWSADRADGGARVWPRGTLCPGLTRPTRARTRRPRTGT